MEQERLYKAVVKDNDENINETREYGPFTSQEADCFLTGISLGDIEDIEIWKERIHKNDVDTDFLSYDHYTCKRSHYRGGV